MKAVDQEILDILHRIADVDKLVALLPLIIILTLVIFSLELGLLGIYYCDRKEGGGRATGQALDARQRAKARNVTADGMKGTLLEVTRAPRTKVSI